MLSGLSGPHNPFQFAAPAGETPANGLCAAQSPVSQVHMKAHTPDRMNFLLVLSSCSCFLAVCKKCVLLFPQGEDF